MKLIDSKGYPSWFTNAFKQFKHERPEGSISVTGLISPTQKVLLEQKHQGVLTAEVEDTTAIFLGQAVHKAFEESIKETGSMDIISEATYKTDGYSRLITGTPDIYDIKTKTVYDIKVTGAYKAKMIMQGEQPTDWANQLNVYRWLMHKNGRTVDNLVIVMILKDWSKREASYSKDYPQSPIMFVNLDVWSLADATEFVAHRLNALELNESGVMNSQCTSEEMWERPTKWALKKIGAKKAKKLYTDKADADAAVTHGYAVEKRPGERPRCQTYCSVAKFCPQYKEWMENK